MATQYVFKDLIATTVAQSVQVNAGDIVYISNDDDTNKLYISLSGDIADNYITILPSEIQTEWPSGFSVGTLWYKSSTSTVPFRFLGDKSV